MMIGIFGASGCGKTTLAEEFKKEGFPSCIDVNIKNVSFSDIDENEAIDFTKKHYCYIGQDASHAGFESYSAFDYLIIGYVPKAWAEHYPFSEEDKNSLGVSEKNKLFFQVFYKNCQGGFSKLGIIERDINTPKEC